MVKINKKFYVTTSIPYVNAKPHIGFALEAIQADVLARHHRNKGEDVFFLTGADEHGIKIVRAAEEAGKSPEEFVNEISGKFKALKDSLNLSWDDFIRTSDGKRHWPGAQKLWRELERAGDIYKKNYRGLYCVGHEAFVTEKDLVDGKCRDHQKEPEVIEEENYFFRLSKYSKDIETKIKSGKLRIVPESRKNEIMSLLKEGLEDISFSRPRKDLSWGVPVPNDPDHTMYVWCDALSNYISVLGYGNKDESKFKKYWPADIHVIGKDILRFHAAIWPGMLLSAGLPLPKSIFVHGFITVGGEKMSKTIGNVVDPFEIVKKYGADTFGEPRIGRDALRYYLLREIPSSDDGDFTYEKFKNRYNSDLAKDLGNLLARILALMIPFYSSIPWGETESNKFFSREIENAKNDVNQLISDFKFNESLERIWRLVALGNKFIDDERPWTLNIGSQEWVEKIGSLIVLIREIGNLLLPFLPKTSEEILRQVKTGKDIKALFPRLN